MNLTQQHIGSDSPTHNSAKEIYREGNSVIFPAIGVSVELGTPYLWRDWQPIVNSPGPDGGSPLYVSFDFLVTNSSESRQEFATSFKTSSPWPVGTPVDFLIPLDIADDDEVLELRGRLDGT